MGDQIRVILDLEENTLAFEMHNEFLGVAFRGMLDLSHFILFRTYHIQKKKKKNEPKSLLCEAKRIVKIKYDCLNWSSGSFCFHVLLKIEV